MKSLNVSERWLARNPTPVELLANYSPAYWAKIPQLGSEVYFRECPALGALAAIYRNHGVAASWIQAQVTRLFIDSSSADVARIEGITSFSENFAAVAAPYKLTELMLFFSRYRAGRYDNSYSAFDARRIGLAFHKEFLPERAREIAAAEAARRPQPDYRGAISREDYEGADEFTMTLEIRNDSEEMRQALGITEVDDNRTAAVTIKKQNLPTLAGYVSKGTVVVVG